MVLGVLLALGLSVLGYQLADAMVSFKAAERAVTVKGSPEREVAADTVIWPIRFNAADDDLQSLYSALDRQGALVTTFLHGGVHTGRDHAVGTGLLWTGVPRVMAIPRPRICVTQATLPSLCIRGTSTACCRRCGG